MAKAPKKRDLKTLQDERVALEAEIAGHERDILASLVEELSSDSTTALIEKAKATFAVIPSNRAGHDCQHIVKVLEAVKATAEAELKRIDSILNPPEDEPSGDDSAPEGDDEL